MLSYVFDDFELQPAERRLLARGAPLALGPRALDLLLVLVRHAGQLVTKEQLLEQVWPDVVVVENNLQVQISALRKLLGPDAIATVTGQGYRFTRVPRAQAQSASPAMHRSFGAQTNVPYNRGPLFGRGQDLDQLQNLLQVSRLVTVTGPGGVGKTRLMNECALAAASRFADGAWLVELASLNDADTVAAAVAASMRIEVKDAASGQDALALHLRERQLLLLLDNCEHLVEPVATLVDALLAVAPRLQVMTSSQDILGIGGEQVFRVRSLSVPTDDTPTAAAAMRFGAVELFTARARAGDQAFSCNDQNAPLVAAICRRLDGIPLAIEIAAARVPALGLSSVARLLDERFLALTAGRRSVVPRQRTLQATLDWSHRLLSERERRVFRRVAGFVGGFSLAAGAAVASDAELDRHEVIDAIGILVTKSLLAVDSQEGQWRYRLLEVARTYALERLAEADEVESVARRAASHWLSVFGNCFDDWTRQSDAAFDACYGADLGNLRAALDWAFLPGGDARIGVQLTGLSGPLWVDRLMMRESEERLALAFAAVQPDMPAAWVAALNLAAGTFYYTRLNEQSITALRAAASMLRALGETPLAGYAFLLLGNSLAALGQDEAEQALSEARKLLVQGDHPRVMALLPKTMAMFYYMRGMPAETRRENLRALALAREGGYDMLALTVEENLADSLWLSGDLPGALEAARNVIERCKRVKAVYRINWGWIYGNYFGILVECGELAEAGDIARFTMAHLRESSGIRLVLDHFALRLAKSGHAEPAARVLGWINHYYSSRCITRQPNELRAMRSTEAILIAQLPSEDLGRLFAEGMLLDEPGVCQLAVAY